ncbi:MAG: ComF family protein, partial [Proteobacteria bacterium]|nr:ComF family protein [Pseudomonadota bacterium]
PNNVYRAFKITALSAKHVAVVDDVITTGSTIKEFSRTLRRAGVQQVDVWCCARTTRTK